MDPMNKDPSSSDGAVPNWRAGLSRKVRLAYGAAIACHIYTSPVAQIPVRMALTTAARVEGGFYKEATSKHDYRTRVNDYIQSIPRPPGGLQAAPVYLNSQMGHLNISQEQPMAWLCSQVNTILPQQQPQLQQSGPNVDQMEILEDLLALMDISK